MGNWKVNMKTKLLLFTFLIFWSYCEMLYQCNDTEMFFNPRPFNQQQKLFIHLKQFPINASESYSF